MAVTIIVFLKNIRAKYVTFTQPSYPPTPLSAWHRRCIYTNSIPYVYGIVIANAKGQPLLWRCLFLCKMYAKTNTFEMVCVLQSIKGEREEKTFLSLYLNSNYNSSY